jgi:hypothetical protein
VTALILAVLLAIADPVGDAAGDGSLRPPTTGVYAGSANFDLHSVDLLEGPSLVLEIVLGALDNPGDLANGFSHPVIEVYLDSREGGERELLAGSGMRLPADRGWETALRITGDLAELHHISEDGDRVLLPVDLRVVDGTVVATTPLPAVDPESSTLFAIVGVYDPFSDSGWRDLSREPSPWAFSSASQAFPVVDLLAPNDEAQRRALQSGALPLNQAEPDRRGVPWLLMMALGVVVAVVGLGLRSRVAPTPVPAGAAPDEPIAQLPVRHLSEVERATATDARASEAATVEPTTLLGLSSGVTVTTGPDDPTAELPDAATVVPPEARPGSAPRRAERSELPLPAQGIARTSALPDASTADGGRRSSLSTGDDPVPTFVIGRSGRGSLPVPLPADDPPVREASTESTADPVFDDTLAEASPDPSAGVEEHASLDVSVSDGQGADETAGTRTQNDRSGGVEAEDRAASEDQVVTGDRAASDGQVEAGDRTGSDDQVEAGDRTPAGDGAPSGEADPLGSAWDDEVAAERPDRRWMSAWNEDDPDEGSGG